MLSYKLKHNSAVHTWVRTTPTWSQSWIKTDPVLKSVSVGGAVVTVGVALPSVQTVYNSAQATYLTIEGSKGAIAVVTGLGLGVAKSVYEDTPPDIPEFFNNPYVNFYDESAQVLYKVSEELINTMSSDDQSSTSSSNQSDASSTGQKNEVESVGSSSTESKVSAKSAGGYKVEASPNF